MKKTIIGCMVILAIATIAALNIQLNTMGNKLSNISLANVEALAKSDTPYNTNGSDYTKGYINDPKECKVSEVVTCTIGFTIPPWIPYIGGLKCEYEYTTTVELAGTMNHCTYTGNKDSSCTYYSCKKNGT